MATIALDVHTHLVPVDADRLAAFDGVTWLPADGAMLIDGHRLGLKSLFRPADLVAWMDRYGVTRALVSAPPPTYRPELGAEPALAWVRYLNTGLRDIAAASGGRLGALYHLPLEHPSLLPALLDELDDAWDGVALPAGGSPRIRYDDRALDPLWQRLDARAAFAFLHPGACGDTRLAEWYLENLVGNPYETAVAASHLVMAGVPARHPRIRFCLAHAGGAFPMLCGRLERGFDTRRPGIDLEVERPLQAARRFMADGICHHPAALRLAREVFGEDRVVFGSDWPFPMGIPEPAADG